MPLYVWLAAAMVAFSIPVLLWAVRSGRSTNPLVRSNLGDMSPIGPRSAGVGGGGAHTGALVEGSASVARRFTPPGSVEHLEKRLISAGLDNKWSLERVLALKFGLVVVAVLLGALQAAGTGRVAWLLLGGVVGAGLFWVPDLQIGGRARQRDEEIELQLPDIIDQVTITVEAGLGFESSMRRVAGTAEGPLVDEFRRVLQDIHMGFPRDEAMQALSERTEVQDLRLFAAAVTQAGRYGISIADVLRSQSAELREKRRFRAEERAQKIPVKIVMPLIACILPVLFIVLLGPAALRIAGVDFGG